MDSHWQLSSTGSRLYISSINFGIGYKQIVVAFLGCFFCFCPMKRLSLDKPSGEVTVVGLHKKDPQYITISFAI